MSEQREAYGRQRAIVTIGTVEVQDRVAEMIASARAQGWTDQIIVYCPDNHAPPQLDAEVVMFKAWWASCYVERQNRQPVPCLGKPDCFLDTRWNDGDQVLYVDGSDVVFFENPAKLFDLTADGKPLAMRSFRERGHKARTHAAIAFCNVKADEYPHYNAGVIMATINPITRVFMQHWRALNLWPALNMFDGGKTWLFDQTLLCLAVQQWREAGTDLVHKLDECWNLRGIENVQACRLESGGVVSATGDPVYIAHASGPGASMPQWMIDHSCRCEPREPVKYSVIIPAWKCAEFIGECLDAIKRQAHQPHEILIGVDNCPETLAALDGVEGIQVYRFTEHVGPYVIRNTLAAMAEGDVLVFTDADDYWRDDFTGVVFSRLDGQDEVRWRLTNFWTDEELQKRAQHGPPVFVRKDKDRRYRPILLSMGQFATQREAFLRMNGFLPWPIQADSEYYFRTRGHVKTVELRDKIYNRRKHPNALTVHPDTGLCSDIRRQYENMCCDNRGRPVLPEMATTDKWERIR